MPSIYENMAVKKQAKPQEKADGVLESAESVLSDGKSSFAEKFFATNEDFYRHYAGDSSVAIKPASEAPQKVETMGIDLENGVMYVNPVFFEDKAYSLDKANFAVMHEFEHFLELKELLDKNGGDRIWERHSEKLKTKKRYAIFDNCLDDVKMNRSVLKKAPVLEKTEEKLYRENLFPQTDFSNLPKHLQFSYAILREARLPQEQCQIAPDVRAKIDGLKNKRSKSGVSLVDYTTSPYTPMAMRIKLQEAYFEPIVDEFFEEDVKKKQQEEQGEGKDEKGGKQKTGESNESGKKEGGQPKGGDKDGDKKTSTKSGKGGGKKEAGEPHNPEDYFQKEYEQYDKNNPHAIQIEDIEKAVKKYVEAKKEGKSLEDMSKEAYAKAEGVSIAELDEYKRFWQELENITNPETNETVIEELRAMFKKIINERKKKKYVPKYPTEDGEILAFPAEAVIAVKRGEREPKVWETVEQKEKLKEMYGDFDVTLVGDRSGSMKGEKARQQRRAMALALEALKDFCDELEEARKDIEYDLHVRTEAWSFGDENQVEVLKPLSDELTEKQRVYAYKKLADTPGDHTYDFLALEKIRDGISKEDLRKIREGKLKKIIGVFSDGQSSDAERTQRVLADLREKGVKIVGIGITKGGKSIETTYAPHGKVCEKPEDLAKILGDLLKNELKDV